MHKMCMYVFDLHHVGGTAKLNFERFRENASKIIIMISVMLHFRSFESHSFGLPRWSLKWLS